LHNIDFLPHAVGNRADGGRYRNPQSWPLLFEGSLDELRQSAQQSGFAADNLEDMFLSMIEMDNATRKQRAQL
jgi:hypothetical protein